MKKLIVIALAIAVPLSISAGASLAGKKPPAPNLLITKTVELDADGVNSTVRSMNNITNIGTVNTTVSKVTDTLYCQSGDGWEVKGKTEYEWYLPDVAVGGTLELEHLFTFDLPVETQALKNVVEVEVEGSKKVFDAKWTLEFEAEETEAEETETTKGEPVGDRGPAVKTEWQSGKSHCWHFNYANGDSGILNCKIDDDGNITGVFNGKVSDKEEWYCLKVGDYILGGGTANKAGKLHIKVEGDGRYIDWGENGPEAADLSLDTC